MDDLPAISRQTEASLLTQRLRDEIVSGAVRPGSKLKLVPLSQRFEVSRGPLREAVSRLASEGLVTIEDQRGFRVAPISLQDLTDVTETRTRIETLALRDSIAHGDLGWEGAVLAACHVLDRVSPPGGDGSDFAAHHRRFHEALVAGCPSAYLLRFREHLYALTERYRNLASSGYTRGERDVAAEHRALAEAAVARNADLACTILTDHLRATARTLITSYPALFTDAEAGP